MVKFILILTFALPLVAGANIFSFGSDKNSRAARIPNLVENLKKTEMKDDPAFEEAFNQTVKAIENALEEEKLYCSGESADEEGKTLAKEQKHLCMRELKKQYLEATNVIFDLKKKYLGLIHKRQLEKLTEIQSKVREDIEKTF
jgi:hypothetical protein